MPSNCPTCGVELAADLGTCPACTSRSVKAPETSNMDWDALLKPGQTAAYGARPKTPATHQRIDSPAMLHAISGAVLTEYKVGDVLGQYELKEMLGQGGMGTVFLAEHKLLERRVAIKILLPEFADQLGIVHRFFKEAQAVNRIGHPNIVDIMDCVEGVDHLPYLVMELLEGESLQAVIQARAPMRPEEVVSLGRQICSALSAVHAKGIVHRDLKPENLFVSQQPDGSFRVKLLDFGIAKFMAADDSFLKTLTGEPIGTPEYMAPEQIEGVSMDHRIDIYAMGVMFFEMLTGKPTFEAAQIGQLLFHHLNTEPESPSVRRVAMGADPVPEPLEDAILSCLAKDPDQRVQSMSQLVELLEWSLEEDTGVVVLPDLEAVEVKARQKRQRWMWPAMGAVAASVLLVLGGWWFLSGSGAEGTKPDPRPAAASLHAAPAMAPRPGAIPLTRARKVAITSAPSGASIYRVSDGTYIGRTPHVAVLNPSDRWRLRLFFAGHKPAVAAVSGVGGGPVHVVLVNKTPRQPVPSPDMDVPERKPKPRSMSARPRTERSMRPRSRQRPRQPPPVRRRAGDIDTVNPFD
jgi:eukaryotic-like serine/threonine-protein kinase